jgi:hypothetical protein
VHPLSENLATALNCFIFKEGLTSGPGQNPGRGPSGGKPPGSSKVLAFYKQYNQRKKLIKMQENLYILFDAVRLLVVHPLSENLATALNCFIFKEGLKENSYKQVTTFAYIEEKINCN